ncbi:MAG: TlpA family protein disulfide reductase [Chloroflexota bacterium]|nr:TlpA family protein disulfide reductase [Chloroflexota bacterium]
MRRLILVPLIVVPVLVLLWTGFGRDPNAVPSPLVSRPAPDFTLTALDGRRVSLRSMRGHPVVINFWASWCTDCATENPYLSDAWRLYAAHGVRFIGISFNDGQSNAGTFMHRFGDGWTDLEDPGARTAISYGVSGVPETFLIDGRGRVVLHVTGPILPGTRESPQVFEAQLQRLATGAA